MVCEIGLKVDCSAVAAGGFSTAADEEFGRAGVEEGSGEAGMPAPAHMVSLGRAGVVEFVAARRFDVVVKSQAGLTCVDFLILFAGFLAVVAMVLVGEDGRLGCGWLTSIPSSSGISPVCSKAGEHLMSCFLSMNVSIETFHLLLLEFWMLFAHSPIFLFRLLGSFNPIKASIVDSAV